MTAPTVAATDRMAALRAAKQEKRALQAATQASSNSVLVDTKSTAVVPEFTERQGYVGQRPDDFWMDLARSHGVRLPFGSTPCTTGGMRQWLSKLGLSVEWFYEWTGMTRLGEWPARNPSWNLRSFVGLLLEETQP